MSFTAAKIASGLSAVFLGGGGVGYYLANSPAPAPPTTVSSGAVWSADILGRLTRDLGLTPEQQVVFARALDEAGQQIADQRERSLFQIHLEVLAVHDRLLDIPGELAPAQESRLKKSRDLLQQTISERFSSLLDQDPAARSTP
jgi:hypothetical protein